MSLRTFLHAMIMTIKIFIFYIFLVLKWPHWHCCMFFIILFHSLNTLCTFSGSRTTSLNQQNTESIPNASHNNNFFTVFKYKCIYLPCVNLFIFFIFKQTYSTNFVYSIKYTHTHTGRITFGCFSFSYTILYKSSYFIIPSGSYTNTWILFFCSTIHCE